jgi:very-short-patch-repair endonuclease
MPCPSGRVGSSPTSGIARPEHRLEKGANQKVWSLLIAMASRSDRNSAIWQLVRRQHGVITRSQLLELGLSKAAIAHRLRTGRLHRLHRGVYVIGGRKVDCLARWMAAVLACGRDAVLSHHSAAELWGIRRPRGGRLEVSVGERMRRRPPGIHVHRRSGLSRVDRRLHRGIPVTSPARTLVDLAGGLQRAGLESAVNEADRLDLIHPEQLRRELDAVKGQHGIGRLRELLNRRSFRLTDSELERRFLALVRFARLPMPETRQVVSGFRVDFFWPDLGLVVETDGLRYHRTPAQQARDRRRDQAHTAAGLAVLRFTNAQIRFEATEVCEIVERTVERLARRRAA